MEKQITHFTDIKSYEDACQVLKKKPSKKAKIYERLRTICKAINSLINNENNAKFPDYKNTIQRKWFPYFTCSEDSWVFFFSSCGYCRCDAWVGVYKTQEASDYAGRTFFKEYVEFIEDQSN